MTPEPGGHVIAAVLLFTAEPSDRALAGWAPREYLEWEADELAGWAA